MLLHVVVGVYKQEIGVLYEFLCNCILLWE